MQFDCRNDSQNIYLRCRYEAARNNKALRSREDAAEVLGISPSSLANYERGITKVVPIDQVVAMASLYNAPELLNHYCSVQCPVGRNIPCEVKPISSTALKMVYLSSNGQLEKHIESLVRFALAGEIDVSIEKPEQVVAYFNRIRFLIEEIELFTKKTKGSNANGIRSRTQRDTCK